MNLFAIIILSTLIIVFFMNLIADFLNTNQSNKKLPDEFSDICDEETYQKTQLYNKTSTRFSMIHSSFSLSITLVFWFMGGFNHVDVFVRGWDLTPLLTGMIYISLLILANAILSIPFSLYSTFVIEEKFGFNKTTVATFILDLVKSFFLALILGLPLLAGILYFLESAGNHAWLYCWVTLTIFSLVIQFIAPIYILPLFNKFTALEDGHLKTALLNYGNANNFSIKDVFVIDGSRRSNKANAFVAGFGRHKRVALYDTLIKNHSDDELVAVLAHEVGHDKNKHIIKGMLMSILSSGLMFYLLSLFLSNKTLFEAFYVEQMSVYLGLILFSFLFSPINTLISIFANIMSRTFEYEADHYAAKTLDNKENMITALKKLSIDNLSNLDPHPFYTFLNYSHPTTLQRIRAIKKA